MEIPKKNVQIDYYNADRFFVNRDGSPERQKVGHEITITVDGHRLVVARRAAGADPAETARDIVANLDYIADQTLAGLESFGLLDISQSKTRSEMREDITALQTGLGREYEKRHEENDMWAKRLDEKNAALASAVKAKDEAIEAHRIVCQRTQALDHQLSEALARGNAINYERPWGGRVENPGRSAIDVKLAAVSAGMNEHTAENMRIVLEATNGVETLGPVGVAARETAFALRNMIDELHTARHGRDMFDRHLQEAIKAKDAALKQRDDLKDTLEAGQPFYLNAKLARADFKMPAEGTVARARLDNLVAERMEAMGIVEVNAEQLERNMADIKTMGTALGAGNRPTPPDTLTALKALARAIDGRLVDGSFADAEDGYTVERFLSNMIPAEDRAAFKQGKAKREAHHFRNVSIDEAPAKPITDQSRTPFTMAVGLDRLPQQGMVILDYPTRYGERTTLAEMVKMGVSIDMLDLIAQMHGALRDQRQHMEHVLTATEARAIVYGVLDTIHAFVGRSRTNTRLSIHASALQAQLDKRPADLLAARMACKRLRLEAAAQSAKSVDLARQLDACRIFNSSCYKTIDELNAKVKKLESLPGSAGGGSLDRRVHPFRKGFMQTVHVRTWTDENGHNLTTRTETDVPPPNTAVYDLPSSAGSVIVPLFKAGDWCKRIASHQNYYVASDLGGVLQVKEHQRCKVGEGVFTAGMVIVVTPDGAREYTVPPNLLARAEAPKADEVKSNASDKRTIEIK